MHRIIAPNPECWAYIVDPPDVDEVRTVERVGSDTIVIIGQVDVRPVAPDPACMPAVINVSDVDESGANVKCVSPQPVLIIGQIDICPVVPKPAAESVTVQYPSDLMQPEFARRTGTDRGK